MAAMLLCVSTVLIVWGYFCFGEISAENNVCPSSCSCLGNLVDCSARGLREIPNDVPTWVTYLELQDNGISVIDNDAFKGLTRLEKLDISNNEIMVFNEVAFQDLISLKELKFNKNKLTKVSCLKTSNLTILELNDNQIHTIDPGSLIHLKHLQILELNHNQITFIHSGVFPANSSIVKISLNNNKIFSFEDHCFDNLTSLESLRMNKNRIEELPKELFTELVHLKSLELTKNRLTEIKSLIFAGMENLQALKLRKNRIQQLKDGAFYKLEKLQNLQLDSNNITAVKKGWLYGLRSLKQLNLGNNKITVIEDECWEFNKGLQQLFLSNNRVSSITVGTFSKLENLRFLSLNQNHVSNIANGAFNDLSALEVLELNENEISWTIEDMDGPFIGLEKLNQLSLQKNHIQSVAESAFLGLDLLRVLHLEDNEIISIHLNSFKPLKELQELHINTSSLLCDCHLSWLPAWLSAALFEKELSTISTVCGHPVDLKGKSVMSIDLEAFKCAGENLRPIIRVNPKSQIALRGGNITLNCTADSTGEPPTQVQWKKDNFLIPNAHIENLASSDGNIIVYTSKLHLHHLQDEARGRYHCVISNKFGSAYSKKALIAVHVFPKFSKVPEDVTVKAGSMARLECAAAGNPPPIIAWQKDGGDDFPAARQRRMHVIPTDDVFFIVEVRNEDEGVYSCTAKNDAGIIIANASLTVLRTPSFTRPMENKYTEIGETTVIECLTAGSPQPKLRWLKDGSPLDVTQRHFFAAEDQLLVIVQTSASDAGRYTCEMSNTLGRERGTSVLTVMSDGQRHSLDNNSRGEGVSDNESTTTGIIIIAVVCCVVGTSLVWVIIIYRTRKQQELYSATPTDETTLPGEVPSSGYLSSEKEGSYTDNGGIPVPSYHYQDYQMKESGYESSSGQFRAARSAAIFPSDVDEDQHTESIPLTIEEQLPGTQSGENSISSLPFPNSETDSLKSSGSGDSSLVNGQHTLQTFNPQPRNHDTLHNGDIVPDNCLESCDHCNQCYASNNVHSAVTHHPYPRNYHHGIPVSPSNVQRQCMRHHDGTVFTHHHGSQPPGCSVSDHEEIPVQENAYSRLNEVPCSSCQSRCSPVHSCVNSHLSSCPKDHNMEESQSASSLSSKLPDTSPKGSYLHCCNHSNQNHNISPMYNAHDCTCHTSSALVSRADNSCANGISARTNSHLEKVLPVIPPKPAHNHRHMSPHSHLQQNCRKNSPTKQDHILDV